MNQKKTGKGPIWPRWAPAPLLAAHASISKMSPADWIAAIGRQERFSNYDAELPVDYLEGIGSQSDTLKVLVRLCTDRRMESVWRSLSAFETAVRAGELTRKPYSVLRGTQSEIIVSCVIAQTIAKIAAQLRKTDEFTISKVAWKAHHMKLAKAASALAELLIQTDKVLDRERNKDGVNTYASLLSVDQLHEITSEIYGRFIFEPDDPRGISDDEKMTDAELELEDKKWNSEVAQYESSVQHLLLRSAPNVSTTLSKLEEYASFAARHPPYLPASGRTARITFLATMQLSRRLQFYLTKPLDNEVAMLVSVAFGCEIDADAIKTSRARRRRAADERAEKQVTDSTSKNA